MRYPVQVHIMAVHLKIKPFVCGQCSYASVKESMLDKHFREVHLKLKPHKCNECSFSCSIKVNLQDHVNAKHLKIKPFNCEICSFSSATRSSLSKHKKTVHLKIKPHKCPEIECSFASSKQQNLQYHINSKHLMVKPFKCNQCYWSSASKSRLSHHIKKIHVGSKPETSEIQCEDVFDSNNVEEDLTKILSYPELSNPEKDNSSHELGYHLEIDSLEDASKMKPFKCCACDAAFNLKCFLNIHVRKVHGKDKDVQNQQM